MTPTEKKAREIYERFYLANKDSLDVLKIKSKAIAKTNALICVDEILDVDCFDMSEEHFNNHIEFYQEVKQHIEKL